MDYPFDIGFASAPGANDFWLFNTTTMAHNSADGTIDLSIGGTSPGGIVLKSTPPVSKLTFGAEVMFTGNNSGILNLFGLWLLTAPETTNYSGFRATHTTNAVPPVGDMWYVGASDGLANYRIPFQRPSGVNGVPAFAPNVYYDLRVEYIQSDVDSVIGAATVKFYVNGFLITEFADVGVNCRAVTPGIFLQSGRMKVRRMYGDITPAITQQIPIFQIDRSPEYVISDDSQNLVYIAESPEESKKNHYANDKDLTIRGRVLDESFNAIQELVYVYENRTMDSADRVASDPDGFYEITGLDSTRDYTIMVRREGKMRTVPMADYAGFAELAGTYRIRGENVGQVDVKVFSEQTGEYLGHVDTDANGQFRIPNVNPDHKFTLVFREPSGLWEDRVSSRRIPEFTTFTLMFDSTLHDEGDRINGAITVTNGRAPFTAEADGLKPGVSLVTTGNQITFSGETVMQGPYSIPITVKSFDGGEGVFVASGVAGYLRSNTLADGNNLAMWLQAEIDREDVYFYTNTKTLLNFDSGLNDDSPAGMVWSNGPGTSIDTTNKKFGAGSLKYTGSGGIMTYGRIGDGIQLGTGDFTLEAWVWLDPVRVATTCNIFTVQSLATTAAYGTFYYQGASMALQAWNSGTGKITSNTVQMPTSQWVHVAFSRTAGTIRIFQNGIQVASAASAHNFTQDYIVIGGQTTTSSTESWIGNIDDARITVGVGRYTANFTPPTKAYANNK